MNYIRPALFVLIGIASIMVSFLIRNGHYSYYTNPVSYEFYKGKVYKETEDIQHAIAATATSNYYELKLIQEGICDFFLLGGFVLIACAVPKQAKSKRADIQD